MQRETLEARLAAMHEALVEDLLGKLKSEEETHPSDKRLALDLIKYNQVRDLRPAPSSKIPDLIEELPFETLDQEID